MEAKFTIPRERGSIAFSRWWPLVRKGVLEPKNFSDRGMLRERNGSKGQRGKDYDGSGGEQPAVL